MMPNTMHNARNMTHDKLFGLSRAVCIMSRAACIMHRELRASCIVINLCLYTKLLA